MADDIPLVNKHSYAEHLLYSLSDRAQHIFFSSYAHAYEFFEDVLGKDVSEREVAMIEPMGILTVNNVCSTLGVVIFFIILGTILFNATRGFIHSPLFRYGAIALLLSSTVGVACITPQSRNQLMDYFFGFHFDTPAIVDYDMYDIDSVRELSSTIGDASTMTVRAAKLWFIASLRMLAPIIHITIMALVFVLPYVKLSMQNLVQMFIAQDDMNIALEIMTVVAVILLWLLKRHIEQARYADRVAVFYGRQKRRVRARYDNFLRYVQEKSLFLASLLPHFILIIPVVAFIYLLPDIAASLSGGWIVVIFALIMPLFKSVRAIEMDEQDDKRRMLMYWVVLSIPVSLQLLMDIVPFANTIVSYIPLKEQVSFLVLLWLLLPWTDGVSILYNLFLPILSRFISVPETAVPVTAEQRAFLVRMLIAANIISEKNQNILNSLVELGVLLIGSIFFITPGFITAIGIVFVAVLCPMLSTITAIGKYRKVNVGKDAPRLRLDESAQARSRLESEVLSSRLVYWVIAMPILCIFALFEAAGMSNMYGWYHIKLGVFFALQLPFLHILDQIYGRFVGIVRRLGLLFITNKEGDEVEATAGAGVRNVAPMKKADGTPSSSTGASSVMARSKTAPVVEEVRRRKVEGIREDKVIVRDKEGKEVKGSSLLGSPREDVSPHLDKDKHD